MEELNQMMTCVQYVEKLVETINCGTIADSVPVGHIKNAQVQKIQTNMFVIIVILLPERDLRLNL